jgi:hypothetical protein
MPAEQRAAFLKHVEEEMDQRIGNRMSDQLSDEKFDEFVKMIDGDAALQAQVLASVGDYKNTPEYKALLEMAGGDSPELEAEYAGMLWVSQNVPEYEKIVDEEVAKLIAEIKANKDNILAV